MMGKRDLKPGEDGPVFYAKGYGAFVPDPADKPMGALIGEIQNRDGGYFGFSFAGNRIRELGEHESFDRALNAFFDRRFKNQIETEQPRPVQITARIHRKKWHVCFLCGLHDQIVKSFKLGEQNFFICPDCSSECNSGPQEKLVWIWHVLQQRPKEPDMSGWKKISERGGFELWHRAYDSGVYADNFSVVRGKQLWQLGTNGAEMIETPSDREMREQLPVAYDWAVDQIGRFCLQRAQRMLATSEEQQT